LDKNESISVFLMVLLLAFAVILVDERWLRTAVAVLPALMLAQKAMGAGKREPEVPAKPTDRRTDEEIRGYIDRLLKHFREFYTTCHLMGANVLTPEAAEERVAKMELDLNKFLAEVTEVAKARAKPAAG